MIDDILAILERLVAFDTRNPPRDLTAASDVFAYLRAQLPGFQIDITDEGHGSVSFLAVRGRPTVVFNYHLDTVPVAEGWQRDPFVLHVADGRATGLGACDIKGALAVMLSAVAQTDGDVALLITSDEEAGQSTCVRSFLSRPHGFKRVIVAEPTRCEAITSHRGIVSGRLRLKGVAGHASEARALTDSANHRMIGWGAALLDAVKRATSGPLADVRVNLGRLEGGVKPNMIAASATAAFNLRTPPGSDARAIVDAVSALAAPDTVESLDISFQAPSLPAAGRSPDAARDIDALVATLDVPAARPVDFWTEAALFDAAGLPAVVVGSGDIAQAHTADEWVALDQLATLHAHYSRWIAHGLA